MKLNAIEAWKYKSYGHGKTYFSFTTNTPANFLNNNGLHISVNVVQAFTDESRS